MDSLADMLQDQGKLGEPQHHPAGSNASFFKFFSAHGLNPVGRGANVKV
jgi:hypothetical protein